MCRACFGGDGCLTQAVIDVAAVYINCRANRCEHMSHDSGDIPGIYGDVKVHMCDCGDCFGKISKIAHGLFWRSRRH